MIPFNIGKEQILRSIKHIDEVGFPPIHESTKFVIRYNGKSYPPKYVLSIANKYINGIELSTKQFSGGQETNEFLKNLGFDVETKNLDEIDNSSDDAKKPLQSYSWTITGLTTAIKELDKSAFLHRGTGIPVDIRVFFKCTEMVKGEQRDVTLYYRDNSYKANIQMDRQPQPRTRLFWKSDFSFILQQEYPEYFSAAKHDNFHAFEPLIICFDKIQSNLHEYRVSFRSAIDEDTLLKDIQSDLIENNDVRPEGSIKYYYGKRYERDAKNRKMALKIHGFKCIVCKFDFEKVYGVRGKDFIEIHHTKPLYSLEGVLTDIIPESDLVPVCSNCHRMIHRRHDNVLSIEELITIVEAD